MAAARNMYLAFCFMTMSNETLQVKAWIFV